MSNIFTDLISSSALIELDLGRILLLDCRTRLGQPEWGKSAFEAGHLVGAQHADMEEDLATPPNQYGRHPLPTRAVWVERLRQFGLHKDQQVVVYDDAGGAFAARAWWMLRWVGHQAVAVLDGGLAAWPQELESGPSRTRRPGDFEAQPSLVQRISTESVEAHATQAGSLSLVDARTEARWAGQEEPIDPVAGHIPNSVCLPFQGNLDANGYFLPSDALAQRYESLADPIVCYCGSGVTACHNILALELCGRDAALFAPSWSGWITDADHPIGSNTP